MTKEHLANFVLKRIEKTPNKVYLQFADEKITYAQLKTRMFQAAHGLTQFGIQKGDKVCAMLDNSPEYIDLWFGLSMIGSVLVPINTHLKGEGLKHIIDHSDCQVVVTEADYVERIEKVLEKIDREIVIVVNDTRLVHGLATDLPKLSSFMEGKIDRPLPKVAIKSNDLNNILYTSGTTGPPKGVMLTHENYIHSAESFAHKMVRASTDDILFTTLPLFHINAQAHTILAAIAVNATIALEKRFSASKFWEQIYHSQATIFNSLGAMIPILCKQPEHNLERKHRIRLTACAATPKNDWELFEKRFNLKIVEGYGLTETAGFCVTHPKNSNKIGSIGRPYSYVQAKVTSDKEGSKSAIGELALKAEAKYFMKGYYKMPQATKEAVKDGWFYTGDQVYEDIDGYYYFVDRQKQAIRRRGENISSWEVEKAVNEHPAVLESAAVGVPSELAEEDVKIYVVLNNNQTLTPEALIDWCVERLAYFMVPRYVEFVEHLPKTATERIEKYKLKNLGVNNAWDREEAGYELKRS
ncbi:MAG TPA: ATP-dependent acyl-CoA ligase [Bacillota bacterium]|nr:ATP-dependent acyl-CoA ligase [Bacillota bacterium]